MKLYTADLSPNAMRVRAVIFLGDGVNAKQPSIVVLGERHFPNRGFAKSITTPASGVSRNTS